ncbi:MAG: hypothetical protein IKX91_00675, partial [Firmicutes bacterium]|nr:hypothetical protein [Bacillota bacterium]
MKGKLKKIAGHFLAASLIAGTLLGCSDGEVGEFLIDASESSTGSGGGELSPGNESVKEPETKEGETSAPPESESPSEPEAADGVQDLTPEEAARFDPDEGIRSVRNVEEETKPS